LALLVLVAALGLSPVRAAAQISEHKPVPWVVTVTHRVEVKEYMSRMSGAQVQTAGPRFVFNLTSGIVVDADGHVVTRLVNLNPAAPSHDIKITTPTGRILDAEFVGLDQPSGLVVLRVAGLRGTKAAPAGARTVVGGEAVSVVTAEFKIRQPPPGVVRVALYPTLRSHPGTIDVSSVAPAYALAGIAARVECRTLTASGDLSAVEAAGALVGVLRYVSPGRGDLLPIQFVRDVVARRVLAARGSVSSGWLGAIGISLSAVPEPRRPEGAAGGVLIQTISADSPAASAGMQLNDLVVGFEGFDVRDVNELSTAVTATPAGTKVALRVIREGASVVVTPTLGARPYTATPSALSIPTERDALRYQISQLYGELLRVKDAAERARVRAQLDDLERRLAEIEKAAAAPR
jgi:serine protease Do